MSACASDVTDRVPVLRPPRLGFLGLGWIGRQRMQVLRDSGVAQIVAVADVHNAALDAACAEAPDAVREHTLDALFDHDLDGLVIATPSGAHAWQAIGALRRGIPVFCQKPLARTAVEAEQVIAAARRSDCLLGVDFSYRRLAGLAALREAIHAGELGELHAVDLVFHNAYGPDKPWFDDLAQAGGGCVMDLGIHLVDLVGWLIGAREAHGMDAQLYSHGRALIAPADAVEDYAIAQWRTESGVSVRLACSWRLHAGCDAVIQAAFHGSNGGAALRNVDGSFYDFTLERYTGTSRQRLASPPDAWGGRALVEWAAKLAAGAGYDDQCERFIDVARIVDRIYGR